MKYFISKPKSHKLDERIIAGIKEIDSEAVIVQTLQDADIAVFQHGWTKSRTCITDYHSARDRHIERRESYLYTDRYSVKLNRNFEKFLKKNLKKNLKSKGGRIYE